MVEVSLQHIIGTITLIGLVISAGLFYTVFVSYIQTDIRRKELAQISENVALNMEEMINLAKFSKYSSGYLIKILDFPVDLDGKAYKIQLVNNTLQEGNFSVHTFLANQETVSADSAIPYNSGGIPIKLNTTETTYTITVGVDNVSIACSGTIYGKNATVIWADLDWSSYADSPDLITIGIGWVNGSATGG